MHIAHSKSQFDFAAFIRNHDDIPAFNAAYWMLTFIAAMLFNAGVFALLIAFHMALDVFKYRSVHKQNVWKTLEGVVRESLIDVALFLLGITFAVYCHISLPLIAGLQGLLRAELTLANAAVRVGVHMTILHHFLVMLANVQHYLENLHPLFGRKWSLLERVSVGSIAVTLSLLVAAPFILNLSSDAYAQILTEELIPWNF